ncbi:MAG: phytoene synthase [Rhodanobacteraceae bacterium]|nr:MAG: phytoene synthase [Rhodanobacteraceae bacterium]
MSASAFDSYLDQWRDAHPECAVAWLFLRADERACFGALAALEREWLKAVREVREPQVAIVKLGWWREEMEHAARGETRHPLTGALFADARAKRVPEGYWTAPVDAAVAWLDAAPAADFAAQCAARAPFAHAVAALETRVWFDAGADSPRAAEVTLLAHLAGAARGLDAEVEHARSPLPMNLLARHALSIDALGRDSAARRAAYRDYLATLERRLAGAATLAGPLTLFRLAGGQRDLDSLRRAQRADDPVAALRAPVHRVGNVLKTWRAARIWRGMAQSESSS